MIAYDNFPLYPYPSEDPVDQALAAFAHGPEHAALVARGVTPRFLRPLLEFAGSLWMDPDDISGDILVELLYDLPRVCACSHDDIEAIVSELHAFWLFARRELGYRNARTCLEALVTEAPRTLEHAIAAVEAHLRGATPDIGAQLCRSRGS